MMKNGNVSPAMRLKRCNRWLGATLLLTLASGIQLEATSGRYPWSVWVHIILGIVLTALSLRHIYLHYRKSNWLSRFAKNRKILTPHQCVSSGGKRLSINSSLVFVGRLKMSCWDSMECSSISGLMNLLRRLPSIIAITS